MINVPNTISTLHPNGFQFSIQKYPELTYFIQEITLPEISLGVSQQSSSSHDIKVPGDTMEFGDLSINFMIDENMANYKAVYDWIIGLGFPLGQYQYKDFLANVTNKQSYTSSSKATSDCTLTILNSNNLPVKTITFIDAFPTGLSALTFASTNTDVNYFIATLNMTYSYYTMS